MKYHIKDCYRKYFNLPAKDSGNNIINTIISSGTDYYGWKVMSDLFGLKD